MKLPDHPLDPAWVPEADKLPLPAHIRAFRPAQWAAADRILTAFDTHKVVFLDAPTGIGKTVIAELVRRYAAAARTAYLCTTKSLQDQFVADFGYAHLLKGRRNYPTADNPSAGFTAEDCLKEPELWPLDSCHKCMEIADEVVEEDERWPPADGATFTHCALCHPVARCPYDIAKRRALRHPLVVANIAYFLAENRYVGALTNVKSDGVRNPFDLVVLDECDVAENALLGFESVSITAAMRNRMELGLPDRKGVESAWVRWVHEQALPAAKTYLKSLGQPTAATIKRHRAAATVLTDLQRLAVGLESGGWVYVGETEKTSKQMTAFRQPVVFKPIKVDRVAPEALWRHGRRWLCMSATVISPDELAESLGLERNEWAAVGVPAAFEVARRPIVVRPVADVTRKTKAEAWPALAQAIKALLVRYRGQNVLVHTVSYDLTRYLTEKLTTVCAAMGRPLLAYTAASEREQVLAKFKAGTGAVMLAASFDRGIDLPAEQCRVVVVAKVPYPHLGDAQVIKRLYSPGGRLWYDTAVVRSLVQMTGRGMRSADDWCISVILDRQFVSKVWADKRRLLPRWWQAALVWTGAYPSVEEMEGIATKQPKN